MTYFASKVKIDNFKSVRSVELNDCKRINLFIGRPNVGKSNILEAMSLHSIPYYYKYSQQANLKDIIRFEQLSELFFDGDTDEKNANVFLDDKVFSLENPYFLVYFMSKTEDYNFFFNLSEDLNLILRDDEQKEQFNTLFEADEFKVKSFLFSNRFQFSKSISSKELLPFWGENLFNVIQNDSVLKKEFIELFNEYGLNLVFDKASQQLKIMKGVDKGEIFLIPFSSVADSLQRLIFFKAAIKSNTNSIITFEEPEAHTYPPYIAQIAQDIIEAKTNQFFITTHSPYVVSELLANAQDELAIFLVDFKDGETIANRLTDEQLQEVYDDGIDLFFNNELFK